MNTKPPPILVPLILCGVVAFLVLSQGNGIGSFSTLLSPLSGSTALSTPHVVRLAQADPRQYDRGTAFSEPLWWGAACSAAVLAEVMNSYGKTYRIVDVLKEEYQLGVISAQQGLLRQHGIDQTAAAFGFHASWISDATIDKVISAANAGTPVIVNVPPAKAGRLYPGGHFLVVTGGADNRVTTVDSSALDLATWSLGNPPEATLYDFLKYYNGLAVLIEPGNV